MVIKGGFIALLLPPMLDTITAPLGTRAATFNGWNEGVHNVTPGQ